MYEIGRVGSGASPPGGWEGEKTGKKRGERMKERKKRREERRKGSGGKRKEERKKDGNTEVGGWEWGRASG